MAARIISGTAVARTVREEAKARAAELREPLGRAPGLTVVLVGEDPASQVYVGRKEKASAAVGIRSETLRLPADTDQATLLDTVQRLNGDDGVDGILVQLPLPGHIDEQTVIETIDPAKDVDGFHPVNQGRMLAGLPGLKPCTPAGIVELLQRGGVPLSGARVVVVGRSNIVGKPAAAMLMQKGIDATVTVCHSRTRELGTHTRAADVLVAALGRPRAITEEMVRDGAVVIDVGIHRIDDGEGGARLGRTRLVGDVDFDGVSRLASAITPVPGGVGPMTVAMLMRNTVEAAAARL